MNSFVNARVLIKSQEDDTVLADTYVIDHDSAGGTIWVKAENFFIQENTKIEALIIDSNTIHDCLCMARKKTQDGSQQIFSIYKYKSYEERKDNRFRMTAEGAMMVVAGTDTLKNRRIGVSIIDISAGGIGLIMAEQLPVEMGSICEVYFSTNGWSMKAKCVVKNIFGPRLGCRLVAYEKQQLKHSDESIDPYLKMQIMRAMEEMIVCVHYIDCEKDTYNDLISMDYIKYTIGGEISAKSAIDKLIARISGEDERERLRKFYDLTDIKTRMKGKRIVSTFFMGRQLGVCQASFIPAVRDENGDVRGVMHILQKLDEDAYNQVMNEEQDQENDKSEQSVETTEK